MPSKIGLLGVPCALFLSLSSCSESSPSSAGRDAEAEVPGASDASIISAPRDGGSTSDDAGTSADSGPGAVDIDAAWRDGGRELREAGSTNGASDSAAEPGTTQRDGGANDAGDPDAQLSRDAGQADGSGDARQPDARAVDGEDAQIDGEDAQTDDAAAPQADAQSEPTEDAALADAASGSDAGTSSGCSTASAPAVGRLGLRTVVADPSLQGLTDALQPPGSNDWYLVEQRGRVLVQRAGQSAIESEPFLDLTAEIALLNAGSYEDRGLVSIAFAPDYASSGLLYVSVTPDQGAFANVDLLLEYRRSSENAYRVDPASRRTIVELRGRRLDSNFVTVNIHNGGRVAFGPDGMLYLAMGDGGGVNCGDVEPNATQDVSSLFGKILRLDLTQPAPYGALDNPFVSSGDARVWHYGLRNPFRFSFDRLNGDLYVGDVGQNRYEEIDYAPRGASGLNFGWAPYEGNSRDTCPSRELREGSTHTAPIFVADRRSGATNPFADYNAMIGGVVYRGQALPQLYGAYLFGGYRSQRLGALYQCGSATSPVTPILKSCNINEPNSACMRRLDGSPQLSELRAIVEDNEGEIYMVANGNSLLKVVANQ